MKNVLAIFLKQLKDTFKNKSVLIQFLMFPAMTLLMEHTVKLENMPEHFFARLFAVMFVGMAPLTSTSAIIAEEKEQNTLRALMMSNVTPIQYLLGVGSYVWLFCMAGSVAFGLCSEYSIKEFVLFFVIMAAGLLLSILLGAIIGIYSKNQMAATSLAVPVMMVCSFLPMLAMFNETIEKVAKFTYSQQIFLLINGIGTTGVQIENLLIITFNTVLAIGIFLMIYKKKQFE